MLWEVLPHPSGIPERSYPAILTHPVAANCKSVIPSRFSLGDAASQTIRWRQWSRQAWRTAVGIYNDETAPLAPEQMFAVGLSSVERFRCSAARGMLSSVRQPKRVATVRVVIRRRRFAKDLSGIAGAVHVAHIHGQFAGNRQ